MLLCLGSGKERATHHDQFQAVRVRRNLYQLLAMLSTLESRAILWIDAICIDQNSIPERNEQVQLMESIFSQASEVISWVGPANPDLEWLFGLSKADLSAYMARVRCFNEENVEELVRFGDSLVQLALLEYWTRVWIVQEVILAQKLRLCCGSSSVDFHTVGKLTGLLADSPLLYGCLDKDGVIPFLNGCRYIRNFLHVRDLRAQRESTFVPMIHIEELFAYFGEACCTVPQDKIIALLGLMQEKQSGFRKLFKPSYAWSKAHFLFEVVRLGHHLNNPGAIALQLMREMDIDVTSVVESTVHLTTELDFSGGHDLPSVLAYPIGGCPPVSTYVQNGLSTTILANLKPPDMRSSMFDNLACLSKPGKSPKPGDIYYPCYLDGFPRISLSSFPRGIILRRTAGKLILVGIVRQQFEAPETVFGHRTDWQRWMRLLISTTNLGLPDEPKHTIAWRIPYPIYSCGWLIDGDMGLGDAMRAPAAGHANYMSEEAKFWSTAYKNLPQLLDKIEKQYPLDCEWTNRT